MKFEFPSDWKSFLQREFSCDHMNSLAKFLHEEDKQGARVFPARQNIFRALREVPRSAVRAVIIGQDPYHGEGQANGFAFAVSEGVAAPPSLINIFKEIEADLGRGRPSSTTLEGWARQGVLLLNTVLTVRAHEAFSHRDRGWESFTEAVVSELNLCSQPIVFMLWGAPAHKKARLITNPKHLVLRAPHPSPLSAYRGFLGCKHFSAANEYLQKCGGVAIDWLQS